MAITHNGVTYPGLYTDVAVESPAPNVAVVHFPNLLGDSGIAMGLGGRLITIPMVFHNNWGSHQAALTELDSLQLYGGTFGTLVISDGNYAGTYDNCWRERMNWGQIKPDQAGTLDGGHWAIGVVAFYQLRSRRQ